MRAQVYAMRLITPLPIAMFLFACAPGGFVRAGTVITDGSLGAGRTLTGPNYLILPSLGQIRGGNLFQSFKTFDLSAGDVATFSGPPSMTNVLARVTGGQTNINGTVACSITNAAFYLIDADGVVFGPNAALNVKGSFAVTTADYIRHSDGTIFPSASARSRVFSTAPPAAFGFLGRHPPSGVYIKGKLDLVDGYKLVNTPSLNVARGKTLLVVAGTLQVDGGELASSGRGSAEIAAVASRGQARFVAATDGTFEPLNLSSFKKFGPVGVDNGGFVGADARGLMSDSGPVEIAASGVVVEGDQNDLTFLGSQTDDGDSGAVTIRASSGVRVSNGSIGSETAGGDDAGTVTVRTPGTIRLSNGGSVTADLGHVRITADSVFVDDGELSSGAYAGGGRAMTINTSGALDITDGGFVGSEGGPVSVTARSVEVDGENSELDSRTGPGLATVLFIGGHDAAGPFILHASDAVNVNNGGFIGCRESSEEPSFSGLISGSAGPVNVFAANINVEGSDANGSASAIESSSGIGNAAAVTLVAKKAVNISETGLVGSQIGGFAGTRAGPVKVSGSTITIKSGASILSADAGDGTSGRVEVTGNSILLDGEESSDATGIFVQGPLARPALAAAPDIEVDASRALMLRNGAAISADSFGNERSGSVLARAPSVNIQNASITARAYVGGRGGGNVEVDADNLQLRGGVISADNFRGAALGGRVQINANVLRLDQGSTISAAGGGGLADTLTVNVNFPQLDTNLGDAANVVLVGPGDKTRVMLDTLAEQTTYGTKSNPVNALPSFVAADLDGVWNLEVQTPPGQPVELDDWSLFLGEHKIGSSSTQFSGTHFQSPLTVGNVAPGLTGGRAGDVFVNAKSMRILGGSSINSRTIGTGTAGDVNVNAYSLVVSGKGGANDATFIGSTSGLPPGGQAADLLGLGPAGSVNTVTTGATLLQDDGEITVQENGKAAGGDISVRAFDLGLNQGYIIANSGHGGGGVNLAASSVILSGSSRIASNGGDNGGDISIDAISLSLDPQHASRVTANGGTDGGNLTLSASERFNTQFRGLGTDVTAHGSTGVNDSSTDDLDINDIADLTTPTVPLFDSRVGLAPVCGMHVSADQSSFTVEGGNGLPPDPGVVSPSTRVPATRPANGR